jgi:hypothetical protein
LTVAAKTDEREATMSTLNTILDMLYAFRSRQLRRLTKSRTESQLARLPSHLSDDLDLRSLGMGRHRAA